MVVEFVATDDEAYRLETVVVARVEVPDTTIVPVVVELVVVLLRATRFVIISVTNVANVEKRFVDVLFEVDAF